VSAKEVRERFVDQVSRGRDLPTFAWIASYESLRAKDISDALGNLQPPIDLVIMDEAHKVRNTATQQNALAKPSPRVQTQWCCSRLPRSRPAARTSSSCFDLMDPITFERYDVFESQLQANRPVVRALAAIRQNPPQTAEAPDLLDAYRKHVSNAVTQGEFFRSLMERLGTTQLIDRHHDCRSAARHFRAEPHLASVVAHTQSRSHARPPSATRDGVQG
jgi:hypothetical protein